MEVFLWILLAAYFAFGCWFAGSQIREDKKNYEPVGVFVVQCIWLLLGGAIFIFQFFIDVFAWFFKLFQVDFLWMYYVKGNIDGLATSECIELAERVLNNFKQKRMPRYRIYRHCYNLTVAYYERKKAEENS